MPILFAIGEAAERLGGISPWTLRKHISRGNIRVVRIGRRVMLDAAELERIQKDGLPSLGTGVAKRAHAARGTLRDCACDTRRTQ